MRKGQLCVLVLLLLWSTYSGPTTTSTVTTYQTITAPQQYMEPIMDLRKNSIASETFLYLIQNFSPLLKNSDLLSASTGSFNEGDLFYFDFLVPYTQKVKLNYHISILRKAKDQYEVLDSTFVDLPTARQDSFVSVSGSEAKNVEFINLINQNVYAQYESSLPLGTQIDSLKYSVPFYIIFYKTSRGLLEVRLKYDPITNTISVSLVTQSIATKGSDRKSGQKTFTKKFTVRIENYSGLGVSTIAFSDIVPYSEANLGQFQRIDKASAEIRNLLNKLLEDMLPQMSYYDSEYKLLETRYRIEDGKLTVVIILTIKGQKSMETVTLTMPALKAPPKRPTFSVAQNLDRLLDFISGPSDKALIPFLTGSYSITSDSKYIDKFANYLIDKVKLTGDFTIILINEIRYGIRIVIQMYDDHKLFEAVIAFDNDKPQLLSWKRISTIRDVDPDIFDKYFKIQADDDLSNLIKKVFNNEDMVNKINQILYAEKKITFDGIYYQITIETAGGNRFLLKFYYIPEKSFFEILQYEQLNTDFLAEKQITLSIIPQTDRIYNIARDVLNKKYGSILIDSTLAFISVYENEKKKFFRMVFVGINGKHQIIIAVNLETLVGTVIRYEKLENGYVPADLNKLNGNSEFAKIKVGIRDFIKSKFGFDAEPSYFESKQIPGSSSFYKFLYVSPLPLVLTLEDAGSDHTLSYRGIQRLPIAPSSLYYSERLFAGFQQYGISQLQVDDVYQIFFSILKSKTQITEKNHQVIAAFRMTSSSGKYYKVIYRVQESLYLASFSYTFATKQYKLESFDAYQRQVQEGDHRWKCDKIDLQTNLCISCLQGHVFTMGRCYKPVHGCILQIGTGCQSCNPGLIRTRQTCVNSPSVAAPKHLQSSNNNNGKDQNCLYFQESVCRECAYRFVIKNGVCSKVQDKCMTYDQAGLCTECYHGFYMNRKGICTQIPVTCKQSNQDGQCISCYKNYYLKNGQCIVVSNSSSDEPSDPLCLKWAGSVCEKCQYGLYMSRRTGKCSIKPAFCEIFDEVIEKCTQCVRFYEKTADQKECLRVR